MKRFLFVVMAMLLTTLKLSAQVQIKSPGTDLDVQIFGCTLAEDVLSVDLIITNYAADSSIGFFGYKSSVYDSDGNLFNSSNTKVVSGPITMTLQTSNDSVFPEGIPVKYRLQVRGVKTNAEKIALLNIVLVSRGDLKLTGSTIQIRDIEIAR